MAQAIIRSATVNDAESIAQIYRPYVEETAISFEYIAPTADEMKNRIEKTLEKYPYLVLVENDDIAGYCYAGPLKSRSAYDYSVELSIYLKNECTHKGYGKMLYTQIEKELLALGIKNLYACITYADKEDEYHNNSSVFFHEKMGFCLCGRFSECGKKFNRWYDVVWMEKKLRKK